MTVAVQIALLLVTQSDAEPAPLASGEQAYRAAIAAYGECLVEVVARVDTDARVAIDTLVRSGAKACIDEEVEADLHYSQLTAEYALEAAERGEQSRAPAILEEHGRSMERARARAAETYVARR